MAASDGLEVILFEQSQISVVDDDQSFRDSMRRLLKSLDMPAMTGIELYKHLIERGDPIPTILVTAYPDDGVQERMLTLGVECYLRKPLVETVLIDCLRSAVARGKAP